MGNKHLNDRDVRVNCIGEYRTLLEICNVTIEEVKGTRNEKPYHVLLYSALYEEGKRVGTPLKASLYGKTIGLEMLQKHFEKSKQTIGTNKSRENLRPIIAKAMQQAQTPDHLKQLLKEENIGMILRINDENRIYGVTFIDYNSKTVLNGSRLGKEFSANVLEEKFKNMDALAKDPSLNQRDDSSSTHDYQDIDQGNFSLGLFEQHGADYESESFANNRELEENKQQRRMGRRRIDGSKSTLPI